MIWHPSKTFKNISCFLHPKHCPTDHPHGQGTASPANNKIFSNKSGRSSLCLARASPASFNEARLVRGAVSCAKGSFRSPKGRDSCVLELRMFEDCDVMISKHHDPELVQSLLNIGLSNFCFYG